jgi:hypothetical protein
MVLERLRMSALAWRWRQRNIKSEADKLDNIGVDAVTQRGYGSTDTALTSQNVVGIVPKLGFQDSCDVLCDVAIRIAHSEELLGAQWRRR